MKAVYHSFWLLVVFSMASCEKPLIKTGSIIGVVKDATTGEPIANADVFLMQNEIGDGDIWNGGGPSEQIDYTTSDANGNFSFLFDYDKDYRYLCGAEKSLYFDLNQEFSVDEDTKNGNNVEVLLNPVAWLNIYLLDAEPYMEEHELRLSPFESLITLNAYSVDTNIIGSVNGNCNRNFIWVLENLSTGDLQSEELNIYCPSFDTTYYEILY